MRSEFERQVFHIFLGFVFILMHLFLKREIFSIIMAFIIMGGLITIQIKMCYKIKIPYIDFFLRMFERPRVAPGLGSLWYCAGVFVTGLLFYSFNKFFAVVLMLAVGDGLATIFGIHGKHKLPWNKRKTFEGSFAFFAGSLTALIVYPFPITFFVIIVSTVIESIDFKLDDNALIPLAAGALYFLFK